MEDDIIIKAARESIKLNHHTLSRALQSSDTTFRLVVHECVSHRIITQSEADRNILDTFTGRSLAHRSAYLFSVLLRTVDTVPNALDDVLCALHESDSLFVQKAAKQIAKDYQFSLPKYRGLTSSQQQPSPPPAVAYTAGTRPSRQASQSTLTIRNLREVLNDLRDGDFNDKSWHSLGLELGLRSRTLKNIKSDNSEAEECLRTCISKWLSRVDDVDANGGANWSTLCDAIERIGETGAHTIRDRHTIIPSQPVKQINYQEDHPEPSQTAGSNDGLRQRPESSETMIFDRKKWSNRVLKFIIGFLIGVVVVYFVVGFASKWMPKIVLRIFIFGLPCVALITIAFGLIVARNNENKEFNVISKYQTLIVGIMVPFIEPILIEISNELSE